MGEPLQDHWTQRPPLRGQSHFRMRLLIHWDNSSQSEPYLDSLQSSDKHTAEWQDF